MAYKIWKAATVAALLGAAAIQGTAAEAPSCTSFNSTVTVHISTVGDAASVDPDRACLAPGGKIGWTAADGDTWSTDFADDDHSPFTPGRLHHYGKVHKAISARVKACSTSDPRFDATAGGCVFKYKATHVKDGKTSTIDPDVVIKPGT